jgi:4-hydroxy-tetrahydrodipicolinate synthase
LPETAGRLAEVENIIGIKEATGDISRVASLGELCGEDFALYSGDDATACEFMLAGGQGVISVTANVAPENMHALSTAALSGDAETARRLDGELADLHDKLFLEANPIPVKWALYEMGHIAEGIRLPLTPLSAAFRPVLRKALVNAGLLSD